MQLKDKNVLVTGAGGFIGSHLSEFLVNEGCKVRAFIHYNSTNRWGWIDSFSDELREKIEIFAGDIIDPYGVREAMEGIDVIFHLAALIGIPYSYHSPDIYVETNVKGTLNVLQAARSMSVERVIQTSTSEVYGTAQQVPINELHPVNPQSPYAATKTSADILALSFYRSFDLPVIVARPFNTYGPRQSARAVIPTIITQITKGHKVISLGNVKPTRDFNFVIDTCRGFKKLAECDKALGEVVNIGSNYEISIEDTFLLIKKLMNSDARLSTDDKRIRPEKSEVFQLWCDNSKLTTLTGFQPEYSLSEGLEITIDWLANPANLALYKETIYNV